MARPLKNLPLLPVERALKVISGRWKAVILYHLVERSRRLSELVRLMPTISQKVLIQQLREMEAHGLVTREIYRQVPPRVDYSATPLGRSLEPVLLALCDWGRRHAAELDEIGSRVECSIVSLPEGEMRGPNSTSGADYNPVASTRKLKSAPRRQNSLT
jgi:DNA-binding HxlR family transcriptional regulator